MKTLLWLLFYVTPVTKATQITITTPAGEIMGIQEEMDINITAQPFTYTVQKFRGIPYAESPTGNLRFLKPVPKSSFNTAFDATEEGPICHQLRASSDSSQYVQSEDCLRLNIYVPVTSEDEATLKPVMIWIHGGGFVKGEPNSYDGSTLSAFGDVIVVTVSYRLNYFGFYTTVDNTSLGNYGLWDQHLAIKWVKANIQAFHGDPDQITLFGGSSGASSVIYQSFYPDNKGLFKNAIAQSGTITSPWAFKDKMASAKLSIELGKMAGCPVEPSEILTYCLQQLPIEELMDMINSMNEHIIGPVWDEEFIVHPPNQLLSSDKLSDKAIQTFHGVNLMIGYNTAEGAMDFLTWAFLANATTLNEMTVPNDIYNNVFLPHYIASHFDGDPLTEAVLITQHEYRDWTDPQDDYKRFLQLIHISSDYYVNVPTIQTALKHSQDNPRLTESPSNQKTTYAYEFAVQPACIANRPSLLDSPTMALHGDEIGFVFGRELKKACEDEDENNKGKCDIYLAMIAMWTNFAKTGNPNTPEDVMQYTNSEWTPFSTEMEYLRITTGMTSDSMRPYMNYRAYDFWTRILPGAMEMLPEYFFTTLTSM